MIYVNIVVGVSGGIAAYKVVHLVRQLVLDGHEVHVVPTASALRFVGAPTWEAISRHPVTTSVHDDVAEVRHVSLGQDADLVIVAPATANTIARMAAGIADDLLGTTLLATKAPVVIAPAMHTEMWEHPSTAQNIRVLAERGVHIVGPEHGQLTGSDAGPGRMSEPERIGEVALAVAAPARDLAGLHVAVSAGGTREPIDPVRFLGNRSSGRQGVALAAAAADRGAAVTLAAVNIDDAVLAALRGLVVNVVPVSTGRELAVAMREASADADIVIMAAAVADHRPAETHERKLTKEAAAGVAQPLVLVETEDILVSLVDQRAEGQTIVGFAAEMPSDGETLTERAARKAARKGVDLLVANAVGWESGFEVGDNAVTIVNRAGDVVAEAAGSKREVAERVLDAIVATR